MSKKQLGMRFNKNKLRWSTFPKFLIKPVIEVAHFGATKYDDFNFLKGLPVLDTLDSLERHLDAVLDPEESDYDSESECHHLAHVAWNALVALYMLKTRPELDTRWKGVDTESE